MPTAPCSTSTAPQHLGERWQPLAELWRSKQLQYTWLRGLGGRHADFWQVTGEALDFEMASLKLNDPALRERLMQLYLTLNAYPETTRTLSQLRAAGLKLAILSNGSPAMLEAAVNSASIAQHFDAVLSAEDAGVFKPHPSVYQLAVDRLQVAPEAIRFISANGWDAFSAKAFGLRVLWCNRFGQAAERMPALPDGEMDSLATLPAMLGV